MPSRRQFLRTTGGAAGVVGLGSCLAAVGVAEETFIRLKGLDAVFENEDGEAVTATLLRTLSDGESELTVIIAEEVEAIAERLHDIRVDDDMAGRLDAAFEEVRYRVTYCFFSNGNQRCETRQESRETFNQVQFGDEVVVDFGGVGRDFRIHEIRDNALGNPLEWERDISTFSYEDRFGPRGGPTGW